MSRSLFPFFKHDSLGKIYFDNAATSMILNKSLEAMNNYYLFSSFNINRSHYAESELLAGSKSIVALKVAKFIGAKSEDEIVFTSGATESLNLAVFGYFSHVLQRNDEILLTYTEHASNVLPWFKIAQDKGLIIKYIPLDKYGDIRLDKLQEMINDKTKVISIASMTNTNGDSRELKTIGDICKQNNIKFVVDHAQGAAHFRVNAQDMNIDFLAFSGHKIYGPKGIGILYVKNEYVNEMEPLKYGGGMNFSFDVNGDWELEDGTKKFYAGTENIPAILGLEASIDFLNLHVEKCRSVELVLSAMLRKKLSKIPKVKILNEGIHSSIILFTVDGMTSSDVVNLLAENAILIRGGNHCAKLTGEFFGVEDSCRVSLAFYNTTNEIDEFYKTLKKIIKENINE